jgi:thiol-disulfide isomerase/thioredoxin
VLVDFWATWCGPCLREMPHVQALHEELSESGFDVLAISLDEDLEALSKFLEENKVPWTNVIGQQARDIATKYEVRGIPTMMVVDKEGKVVAVANKVETLKPEIKKLLGE